MSVMTVGSWASNKYFSYFTLGNNTSWTILTTTNNTGGTFYHPAPPCVGVYIMIRSVAASGIADGSPFQVLFDQASTPANATVGFLVSGGGQVLNMPFTLNIACRLTSASDILHVLMVF